MKKFIGWLVILMMLLALASCDLGLDMDTEPDDTPETPEDTKIEINLINNGDFEAMDENGNGAQFGWGTSGVTVKTVDGNKVISIATSGAAEFITFQDFSASDGVFSAKVKLSDASDASKVTLIVEMFDDEDVVSEERTFKLENALAETTDWQDLSMDISANALSPYKTKFKVEVADAVGEVLVDDMKFIPDDATKVNFLPFGDFEGPQLEKKWILVVNPAPEGGWPEVTRADVDGDKAIVTDAADAEIISFVNWICPDRGILFPTKNDGKLSFVAKGTDGVKVKAQIELKPRDGMIEQEFTLSSEWQSFSVEIPNEGIQYDEVGIHFRTSGGSTSDKIYIDDVSLNIVEE